MVWLLIGAGLSALAAANAHLIYVAVSSQPSCVAQLRQGEDNGGRVVFSVARSSCPPQPTMHASTSAE